MVATNQKIRRLPGFRFEARTASREDVLPRMDIALFIGFAASGPIGIPVVMETAEQFNAIFGKNLPLVWDKEKGETVYAYLAPTVRAFFRNGGKRCWVIRVARVKATGQNPSNRAAYNFFPLSGLACVHFNNQKIDDIIPAFVRARSKGSWSDDLQIGAAVLSRAVKLRGFTENGVTSPSNGKKILYLEVPANEPIKAGELLRLDFSDKGLALLLTADKIEDGAEVFSPHIGKPIVKITSERFIWMRELPLENLPNTENVQVKMWTRPQDSEDISQLSLKINQAKLEFVRTSETGTEKPRTKIKLEFSGLPVSDIPPAGSLMITKFEEKWLCLQVETAQTAKPKEPEKVKEEKQIALVVCRGIYLSETEDFSGSPPLPSSPVNAKRLAFEIWVKKDEKSFIKLSDLAFNSGGERFWGNLPTDDDLYRFPESRDKNAPEIPAWTQNGEFASSPVAGNGDREGFYFPIFPAAFPENYLGAVSLSGTKLQRDGLEEFDENLFLDEKLKNTGLNNLLNEAEFIRYLSPRPRTLWGIHAALAPETTTAVAAENSLTNPVFTNLSLEEATIISVPDALHRGWYREKDSEQMILSPPPPSSPPLRPEWWRFQDCRKPDVKRVEKPEWGNFLDCGIRIVEAPKNLTVKETDISSGKFTLIWESEEEDKSLKFVLEESATPDFQFPQEIYNEKETNFTVSRRGAGIYYYRVQARIGSYISNWSEGLAVKIPAAENWVVNSSEKYEADVLLAVQRALLRMCAARGDLFAVLDLPEHFDKENAVQHISTLKTTKGLTAASKGVEPFSADEAKALSFGAVYHPWLMTREDNFETVRTVPPCGAVCGVIAHRSLQRGAWIAPANEPLLNVLGLAKEFRRESFLDFQDSFINLVRNEPTGFLVLNAETLSDDPDLRQINVRRLLSLIRRLALRHGAAYVFEPNDERFRRQVRRGFNSLLDLMFARGAFAGATPAVSYQVVVSDSVNNFQSIEQGRFIVELRVAPSLPLKFVTVRLVNAGGRSSVTETV